MIAITKYRSIPKHIEAVQWLGNNADEVEEVTGLNGDYIIKTDNGLLTCRKKIFEELWREY